MQSLIPDMDVVNELLSNQFGADYQLALGVKAQAKCAEQYGGLQKVAVCKIVKRVANLIDKRVELTVEEAVITADQRGTLTHECFIGADSVAETMRICDMFMPCFAHIVVNRRDSAVIAYWHD